MLDYNSKDGSFCNLGITMTHYFTWPQRSMHLAESNPFSAPWRNSRFACIEVSPFAIWFLFGSNVAAKQTAAETDQLEVPSRRS
jgi:hypothetical protein